MAATVGVLCARVRVEEKQLMAALADAGAVPMPLPPASAPLPVGPLAPATPLTSLEDHNGTRARIIVDRCQDRVLAAAILAVCRSLGAVTIDAGLAASGDRLAVATALAGAGLPRPATRLVSSEGAALAALTEIGFPATLLPLLPGAATTVLLDQDAAEAVLEHRAVLGDARAALALIQAGAPLATARLTTLVVDGRAVATIGVDDAPPLTDDVRDLAETTARVLGAGFVGIEIALGAAGPVVWDVQPVPEFRNATPLTEDTVARALAGAALQRLGLDSDGADDGTTSDHVLAGLLWQSVPGRKVEVRDGIALSA